jgi:hypothetical protein
VIQGQSLVLVLLLQASDFLIDDDAVADLAFLLADRLVTGKPKLLTKVRGNTPLIL